MNIDYIREFTVLADTLNFTKAAKKLYCSQPALSKHIASLENQLGVQLVERGEGHVELTPIGAVYLDDARRIVRDFDQSLETIDAVKRAKPMRAVIETYMPYKPISDQLRLVKRSLRQRHPLLQAEVRPINTTSPIEDIMSGAADVCLASVSPDVDMPEVTYSCMYEEPLVAIVRKGHPFATRTSIAAAGIDHNIVHIPVSEPFADVFNRVRQTILEHGADPVFVEHSWGSIDRMYDFDFQTGLFITNAGEVLANTITSSMSSFSVVPFEDDDMRIPCLAMFRTKNENPACSIVVEELRDHFLRTDMSCYWNQLYRPAES